MRQEIIMTNDGSHSLYVPAIDESYHSTHGALCESRHIFIDAGLVQCEKKQIRVLEIGFGTGLNAFLTLIDAQARGIEIHYVALEKYPVPMSIIDQLNYPEAMGLETRMIFDQMHASPWNSGCTLTPNFTLQKIETDFTKFILEGKFDVIYFDAFSPDKQAEMWQEELFKKLYLHCHNKAILTTYCAKGSVRRALQAARFLVERLPGPPGKREMLRARKVVNR